MIPCKVIFRLLLLSTLSPGVWGQALESAQRAFDAGQYAAAADLFEQANRSSPNCRNTFYLGLSRYHLRQFDAALIAFKTAIQCDASLVPAHLALAETYIVMGNQTEALRAYTQALSVEPKEVSALRGAAAIYLRNENNQKAVTLLEKLIALEPGDRQAHVDLGAAYAATSQPDRAEAQFREALRLKPDDPGALTGLGNLYEKKGDDDRAIPFLTQAIKFAPQVFEPRFVLGSAYNRLGRYTEARTELEAALRLGGAESPEIYYQLARAYGNLGMVEQRRTMLAKFSELTSKGKTATENQRSAARLLQEAESLIAAGKLQDAVANLQRAQFLQPTNDHILFRLASVEYDLKDYSSARSNVQQAIQIAPSEWVYHFLLGLTEADSGRFLQARTSLEVAAQLNPSRAEIEQALKEVRHALEGLATR